MRISRLSCSQFAGLRDRSVSFKDGLNVVYGENESGKSTLVRLLARTLFQDARVGDRARGDREFRASFFPSAFRDGREPGDFVDGTVDFETGSGAYTLSKRWRRDGTGELRTPRGDILTDPERIAGELRRELVYGEGVFSEMLLSSQANGLDALKTLLESPEESRSGREIADIVTRAFEESGGGLSIAALGDAIRERIDALEGKHWDAEREAPEPRLGRWKIGVGEVMRAYYELEDAREALESAARLEKDALDAETRLRAREDALAESLKRAENFQRYAGRLASLSWRRERINGLKKFLDEAGRAAAEWPGLEEGLGRAERLLEESRWRAAVDRFERVAGLDAAIARLEEALAGAPSPEDVRAARDAEGRIRSLERQLGGMSLSARAHMEEGHRIEVRSIRTGKPLSAQDGEFRVTEAVAVVVPGVMEMVLSPASVDVSEVRARLEGCREELDATLRRYQAASPEDLAAREGACGELRRDRERAALQREEELRGTTREALRAESEAAGPVRRREEVEADVLALCGPGGLDPFITRTRTLLERHAEAFGSEEALAERIALARQELEALEAQAVEDEDIPAEYREVRRPEEHLRRLQGEVEALRAERDAAFRARAAAFSLWETQDPGEDLGERARAAERRFLEAKEALRHWRHILQVFEETRERSLSSPMRGLADRFMRCLTVISGGRLSSELSEGDRLNVSLYGTAGDARGGRALDYGKLSEGSKGTVALAFRLAVIDHLYPEGGGVAVLDDPLSDMDAPRAKRACRLIREFARRHQVIFLTCREEYAKMLGGSLIRIP